jgi:hypothetical protein
VNDDGWGSAGGPTTDMEEKAKVEREERRWRNVTAVKL